MPTIFNPACKWIMAVLSSRPKPPPSLWPELESVFGSIDFRGEFLPFAGTDYYREEFGPDLCRGFLAFRGLGGPERLVRMKLLAARVERETARDGRRVHNLDIGYMDPDKVVLASFKRGPCKIYIGHGVYADLLLKYSEGGFQPLPWSFPDFRDGRYAKSLLAIREKLKSELRKAQGGPA